MARTEATVGFASAWIVHRSSSAWLHENVLYPRIRDLLLPARGGSILDAGCGDGRLTQFISNSLLPHKLTAFDINSDLVKLCKRRCGKLATIRERDLSWGFDIPPSTFDAVVACNLLMHLDQPECSRFLDSVSAILKKDGIAIVVVTHPEWASYNYGGVEKQRNDNFPFTCQRQWNGTLVTQHYRDAAGYVQLFTSSGLQVERKEDISVASDSSLSLQYAHQIGRPIYQVYKLTHLR